MAEKLTPDTPSSAYLKMAPRLEKVAALWGGTETMRSAGRTFLPQYRQETNRAWETRCSRATLFNYFKKVVKSLAGRPFSRELEVEDMPPAMEDLWEDVDLEGNSLHVFAQRCFTEALAKGLTHWLVDYPVVDAETLEEERMLNARPYWVHVPPEALLAAYTDKVDGAFRYVYARILCEEVEWDGGFGERTVRKVREWRSFPETGKTQVTVWVNEKKDKWFIESVAEIDLPYVPLVTFYAGEKEAECVASLPLNDLADKNIEHWQSSSDQRHCLTVARFPMLAGKGVSPKEGEVVTVGPNELLLAENPNSQYYFVEHKGSAIAAGRTDLEDIKAEMAVLALEMLVSRSNRQTATEKVMDAGDASSLIKVLAINFMDVLNQAMVITGAWIGIPPEEVGEVEINVNFDLSGLDAKALDALIALFNAGALPAAAFVKELYTRGILREDLSLDTADDTPKEAPDDPEADDQE